jgi:hypothetical protein
MKCRSARLATTTLLSAVALASTASPAAAQPGPTPNGFCGAANMLVAGEAMINAMALHTNEHGDAGMFHAVAVSCRP